MIKLDHLTIPVRDRVAAREWYVGTLGLKVEFEVLARKATALIDDGGFTIFVEQSETPPTVGARSIFKLTTST